MHRGVLALSFLLLAAAAAGAAAYDDFARGLNAVQRGESDTAIAAFSAAIAAGDLSPGLMPQAYRDRGIAYLQKGDCDPALADFAAGLKLKPADGDITRQHARAAACIGKTDIALADLTALIDAKFSSDIYQDRGMLRWRTGDFPGAASDFAAYIAARPWDAHGTLWLEMVRARAGQLQPDVAAHDARQYDDEKWPAPLLALYAGKSTPEQALAAAAVARDAARVPVQQCEADFYTGEWLLAKPDPEGGKALIAKAHRECPQDTIEYEDAGIELARLR
ncbi:MAG TPA: tetratricopeptide repeat protein [Rhizomicrobium sp.]|jgi:lipoprotein NlpI|nr:tetratricopeptide repeat protein [Rhizomicrobium sp.]